MKRLLIISLFIGLLPFIMNAQVSVPVQKGEKWGLQRNNEWILKPNYFSMTAFGSNFVAQVKKHQKSWKQEWMLFSQDGKPLLSRNCISIEIINPDRYISLLTGETYIFSQGGEISNEEATRVEG